MGLKPWNISKSSANIFHHWQKRENLDELMQMIWNLSLFHCSVWFGHWVWSVQLPNVCLEIFLLNFFKWIMDSDVEEEFPIDEAKNIRRNVVFQDGKLSDILAEVKTKIPSLDFDDDTHVSNDWSYWQLKQMNKAYFLETAKRLCCVLLFFIIAYCYVLIHQPYSIAIALLYSCDRLVGSIDSLQLTISVPCCTIYRGSIQADLSKGAK